MSRGKLVVISAPSGAGKTTIARAVLAAYPTFRFSVSGTTRPVRPDEIHGRDYIFLTREEFLRKVDAGEFVEWEEIYGDYYGTLKAEVERALRDGQHLLFDVDVKGGLSIKRVYPEACLIFLRPPRVEDLLERLRNRKTEKPDTITRRMERVPMELALGTSFEHQVVNDTLERAIEEVKKTVAAYLTN
jgi:guanylate kinase